ncbi:MAG TPA: serine hydrolase domain-containing protein [Amycolatopsis sp.]|uniref:serine hydrolase domain-containing protein n=1 Tax=Amycolatopsis sp. TaxID=37632 RepID=UPI002B47C2BE|nr:serine hydrolase domain-containing protein [Amycolatopsis sp.]HKS49095.1 serine hydrolase domain-containing protein [Amycolatopsis sp.]
MREPVRSLFVLLAAVVLGGSGVAGGATAALPPLDAAAVATAVRQAPGGSVLGILATAENTAEDTVEATADNTVEATVEATAEDTAEGRDGQVRVTAGRANATTSQPVRADGRFRIASITKTFVATVILQLAAEHRFGIDEAVQRFLPGALPASYPPITVRQLLQQTSGIADYGREIMVTPDQVLRDRWRHWDPRGLVATATAHPLAFPPGTRLDYSNTNYVLLGMLIHAVTGRPWGEEVRTRLLQPLHLTETTVPGDDPGILGPHANGYVTVTRDDRPVLVDATEYNASWADAAGEMISSARDLHAFFAALLAGRLLPADLLAQMLRPYPGGTLGGIAGYGLGIMTLRMPPECGGQVLYGHGAGIVGYAGMSFASRDGRRSLVISVNTTAFDDDSTSLPKLLAITQVTFCGRAGA